MAAMGRQLGLRGILYRQVGGLLRQLVYSSDGRLSERGRRSHFYFYDKAGQEVGG